MTCNHQDCKTNQKVYLPSNNTSSTTSKHPYCTKCGVVKNISTDRGKKLGYFINCLAKMRNRKLIPSHSQFRLIVKEIKEAWEFDDLYSARKTGQDQIVIEIVMKYCTTLPISTIQGYL